MREMLVAVQQRDAGLLRSAVLEVATLRRHFDDQLERALARRELGSLALLLRRTPRQLDRIATLVQRGNLQARVRLLADEADVRTVTRLLNRVVLAGLGGLVGLLSVMLLGTQGGPHFTGDTSLFQFFGYFGLFCATVLILRVIVAILHDGLN
jgi:ubiquinone biosynthesis protein